jgi:hypothetical protein
MLCFIEKNRFKSFVSIFCIEEHLFLQNSIQIIREIKRLNLFNLFKSSVLKKHLEQEIIKNNFLKQ